MDRDLQSIQEVRDLLSCAKKAQNIYSTFTQGQIDEIVKELSIEACKYDVELAKMAKAANLDAIHDTVHEMARDEARHGKAFKGLLERYFG